MVSQEFTTQNAGQTQELAERIAKELKNGELLALYGELGSGKTTFVQGLARGLGIKERVLSPSFTLIRQYTLRHTSDTFYHVDLYRLESEKEAEELGLKELWQNPKNICAIEWAEKMEKVLPKKRWDIFFEYLEENQRKITINKNI